MKKLFLGIFLLISFFAQAQVDTTTLVQKVDYHIGSVAGKKLPALPPLGLTRSLQSLRNVAVTSYNWGNHALAGYATTVQLGSYAPLSLLSNYATTASLSNYATIASLSAYATNASLANYAPLSSLSDYATNSALTSGLSGKENSIAAGTTAQYWRGDKTWAALNSAAVGLGNVDNTSDASKPVSSATQTALNLKANLAGTNIWAGDQLPDGDNTRSWGSLTARIGVVYAINVSKGNTSNSFNLTTTGSSGIVLRLQPTTNNGVIQAPGTAPAETGYRWHVDGTSSANGSLLVTNGVSVFGGNIRPQTNGSGDNGELNFKWNNVYTNAVRGNGTLRLTSGTANSLIISQTSDANTVGQFFATTGALGLQAPGALMTDDGVNRLQVSGSVKATTIVLTNLQVFADNAAAITGGLVVGAVYRTSTGELRVRY